MHKRASGRPQGEKESSGSERPHTGETRRPDGPGLGFQERNRIRSGRAGRAGALKEAEMTTVFMLHRVADYDAWRRVYDSFADAQRQGGVSNQAVYRSEEDPNRVLVMHAFGSSEEAHSFLERPDLREAMQDAGVDVGSLRPEFYAEA